MWPNYIFYSIMPYKIHTRCWCQWANGLEWTVGDRSGTIDSFISSEADTNLVDAEETAKNGISNVSKEVESVNWLQFFRRTLAEHQKKERLLANVVIAATHAFTGLQIYWILGRRHGQQAQLNGAICGMNRKLWTKAICDRRHLIRMICICACTVRNAIIMRVTIAYLWTIHI